MELQKALKCITRISAFTLKMHWRQTKHEIAQELYISERTLYNHIQSIYDKLGAKNAIEAYNKAIALGYITPLI